MTAESLCTARYATRPVPNCPVLRKRQRYDGTITSIAVGVMPSPRKRAAVALGRGRHHVVGFQQLDLIGREQRRRQILQECRLQPAPAGTAAE